MEILSQTVASLAAVALTLYGLLLVAGAPFNKSPQLANTYVRWLGKTSVALIKLPLRLLFDKKKRRRRDR